MALGAAPAASQALLPCSLGSYKMADLLKDLDFFDLDEMLGHEERMVRDTVRQFVQREVLPTIERNFANETFPRELVPQMAELGFFGANLKGYGCAGMNNVAYGLIMQELEAGDSGLRSFASVQSALSMYSIYAWGSEEQKTPLPARDGQGQANRMLRADRARPWLRPGRDGDAGAKRRRRMDSQRDQALDHQRLDRRRRRGLAKITRASPASSSKGARPASPRAISTASSRCARRSPRNCILDDVRLDDSARLPKRAARRRSRA